MNQPLPWQQDAWDQIQRTRAVDRLPHALLLTGPRGIGKRHFADRLVAALLCQSPLQDGSACGTCQACDLLQAGTHPDYREIVPEAPGKAIRVDHIRAYTAQEGLTSSSGGYKTLVIEPADALNVAAANSLLKTLEEPSPDTLMLLISPLPHRLPATIRSRCQTLLLPVPEREQGERWLGSRLERPNEAGMLLDLAAGAPLLALNAADPEQLALRSKLLGEFAAIQSRAQDPVAAAAQWSRLDLQQLLEWYSGWMIDIIRLKADPEASVLFNRDQRKLLQPIASSIEFHELFELLDGAYQALACLGSQLNTQLLLERLLLALAASGTRQRKPG